MRHAFIRTAFKFLGVDRLYEQMVVQDRLTNVKPQIREDIERLLETVDRNNPWFAGKFTSFLDTVRSADDETFFREFAKLPSLSKQDYADAGWSIMPDDVVAKYKDRPLVFDGKPWQFLNRIRCGDFLMPMATGGSTSTPLAVQMTKQHAFSMLYTFFKCWYRMGWRPGHRMLVFYPGDTYYIDDMAKYNRFSWVTGFKIHLFKKIDLPTIRALVEEINEFKPQILLIFPSPLNMIADTIRKHDLPLRYHPDMINTSGETFFDCQRKNAQEVFSGSRIEDSYGSVELGEIAHETEDGLEIFANAAYVETEENAEGQPEMVITRLGLTDFPFIRYRMRDVAEVDFVKNADGTERFVITKIEGKDTNYILSDTGERFYPSFFNQFVNDLNQKFDDNIVEIKVYERGQTSLEVQFIVKSNDNLDSIKVTTEQMLAQRISPAMSFDVKFVDFIDHDYRRKYRVIERVGDIEYAGGIVGVDDKMARIDRQANANRPNSVENVGRNPDR